MLLKRKIPIAMISLVSIPLIFLSIMIYTYTSHTLIELSKNRIRNISEVETEYLNSIITSQKRELQFIARSNEIIQTLEANRNAVLGQNHSDLKEAAVLILETTLENSPGIDNIFAVSAEGEVILSANGLSADVGDKQFFKDAMKGKIITTNIIQSDFKKQKVVAMAAPVRNKDNEVIGVLISHIQLDYFKYQITNLHMENRGYAYVVDTDGIIVSHPDAARVGTQVENETINAIIKKMKNKEMITEKEGSYTYKGREKYMAYGILPDIHWLLVFAQDKVEMNEPAFLVLLLIIITTLTFIILSIMTSIKFSQSITRPIDKLIESMDKATNGDLSAQCSFQSKDEFGMLAKNFNIMLKRLNLSYEELTAIYEELTATEEELRAQYDELQMNEEYLRKSEEKYKLAIEGANDVIWEWDHEEKVFYVSDKWHDIAPKIQTKKLTIKSFFKLVHEEDIKAVMFNIEEHIKYNTESYKGEFRIKVDESSYKWILARGKALRNRKGELVKIAGSMTDISERKEIENKIKYMAYYDTLTKLPNRILFMEKLENELKRSKAKSISGAVMFIDLDNFKNINDTLGHDYGDKLLEYIADKLQAITGKGDTLCRFGGDEFLILKSNMQGEEEMIGFAEEMLRICEAPCFILDKLIYITVSIGIAVYPKDGEKTSVILKNADTAMYTAKALGKNNYIFFNPEMCLELERKIKIESILRQALINNSFELYYQPQVDVKNKKIVGFEALLRLNSEEMGFIPPNEFIPIAEESGLIKEIGLWCLKSACLKNKEWREQGYVFETISVNISAVQFEQGNFIEMVINTLEETGLRPEFLEVEITESVLMKSLQKNIETLERLRKIGIKIALDDFGTGYSSFNYLRKLPIHTLKIDKSFIDGICSSRKEQAIAHGIIQLAHQMSLQVVAEGVEKEEQLATLRAKECDKVQGYLFSKPLPADKAEELMKNFKNY
ncbi:MAG: sensor-containing diguanylate cyclase/phosphodiesterase [Clostridia bacterium]|jgi:diguanylate cyclase (GGDEF)-like protein/PAS domain S-box-containing protein|nr:sensor-containing diguanylate cyclase/phosphodiesterase [Clostridia bacterium]